MFERLTRELMLCWKSLLGPFLSFILRNIITIFIGPWFVIIMVFSTSTQRFVDNPAENFIFISSIIQWDGRFWGLCSQA